MPPTRQSAYAPDGKVCALGAALRGRVRTRPGDCGPEWASGRQPCKSRRGGNKNAATSSGSPAISGSARRGRSAYRRRLQGASRRPASVRANIFRQRQLGAAGTLSGQFRKLRPGYGPHFLAGAGPGRYHGKHAHCRHHRRRRMDQPECRHIQRLQPCLCSSYGSGKSALRRRRQLHQHWGRHRAAGRHRRPPCRHRRPQ